MSVFVLRFTPSYAPLKYMCVLRWVTESMAAFLIWQGLYIIGAIRLPLGGACFHYDHAKYLG